MNKVETKLISYGVRPGLNGFHYLSDAITLYAEHPRANICAIYHKVAVSNNSTPSRVERSIRHAIETAFDSPSEALLHDLKSVTSYKSGKLANKDFIAACVLILQES